MVGEVVIPAPDLTPYATQTWVESKNYLETAPVSSVNGETGAVVLSAADIGALPADTVIPTKTSELTNDSNYVSASTLTASLATKQDALTAGSNITIENNVISATGGSSGFSGDYNDLTNKPDLATVATTGDYDDLTNKPTIPIYTAGTGVGLNDNVITIDPLAVLSAGNGIVLDDSVNTISIDNTVALKSDIPAANTYGDADVADYISDTFGMGVSETTSNVLWGQTQDPQYLNEDSQAEIILEGADTSNPFVEGNSYYILFDLLRNTDDYHELQIARNFTATSVSIQDDQSFNTFTDTFDGVSLSIDY